MAMLTLKGHNEDKVKFSADHLRREVDRAVATMKGVIVKGPSPAPLLRADSYYRYQLSLLAKQMTALSRRLGEMSQALSLPEGVTLSIDIDPVELG